MRTNPKQEITVNPYRSKRKLLVPALAALALFLEAQTLRAQNSFKETDIASDIPGRAAATDPDMVNPWGITSGPTTPFWLANNGSGISTLYNTAGTKLGLRVTLPNPAGGSIAPTGTVFNGDATSYNGDRFLFASEDGVIDGWKGGPAETLFNNSAAGAVYKGLATGNLARSTYLYATDFHNNKIDVFPGFGAPAITGTFTDPSVPAGFAPFNIQNIGGQLYVTYAKQDDAAHDDVAGAGNGFVDVYNLNGELQDRLITQGVLNSPWGLVLAPAGFQHFGGDLLVGNFGDGLINVFDPTTGNFIDSLRLKGGDPVVVDGLWGLIFGNGAAGGNKNELYFTAGIAGDGEKEDHGLFGVFSNAVPEPGTTAAGIGLAVVCVAAWLRRRNQGRQPAVA